MTINATQKFKAAMMDAGITPPADIIADGRIHRFRVESDKPSSKNGWYVFFTDPPAGSFGSWKGDGISQTWSAREYQSLTREEKAAYRANLEAAKAERERLQAEIHAECRQKAAAIWDRAEPAPADHPYLKKKGILPNGAMAYKDALLLPLTDSDGTLHGLQFINPDGDKRFLSGTQKKGHFSIIGDVDKVLHVAEGFATAATIHEATGLACAVAFDAGNLKPVCEALRLKYPNTRLIICADRDESGKGQSAAKEAAEATGAAVVMPPKDAAGSDFNDLHMERGLEAVRVLLEAAPEVNERRFHFVPIDEVISNISKTSWGIRDIYTDDSLVVIVGAPGSGKSFLALDMGLCQSTGIPWHGHEVTNPGPVLYFCGEGRSGIGRRVEAWKRHHKFKGTLPFFISSGPAQLLDQGNLLDVESAAAEVESLHGKPRFVIVDTLARNFGPGDENSTTDMSGFIGTLDRLKARFGCAVCVVHHTGHQEKGRGRGSSSLGGALDFEYLVFKEDDIIGIRSGKVKDYEGIAPKSFKAVPVDLGIDDEGNQLTSLILEPTEAPAQKPRALPTAQKIAMEALRVLTEQTGGKVHLGLWRSECYDRGISDTPEGKRKAFSRARNELLRREMICTFGDEYWLSDTAGHSGTLRDIVQACPGKERDIPGHTPLGVSRVPSRQVANPVTVRI